MPPAQRRVLIIGGSFAGLAMGRDLKSHFLVTIVDAKEFFEYTPGVLRAYVKPKHLDALTFTLYPVIEYRMECKFIWGEVKELNGPERTATIKPIFSQATEVIDWDYCMVAAGCNFGVFHKWGESLWFPTIHEAARPEGSWPHIDERFLEGRRRHVLEEYAAIQKLNEKSATILVVGAGFIGVEWITELEHFFPNLKLTIIDALPQCLGPLPARAAAYCSRYMQRKGIKEFYNLKYNAKDPEFYKGIGLPGGADKEYVCIGVKASNYFMPQEVLSEKGPGGGGWILMNEYMQVKKRDDTVWGDGSIFAVGDCNYGCIGSPPNWVMPPVPKISYPGEEQALHAVVNVKKLAKRGPKATLQKTWWPWGAGMFATSLGPHDACFVMGANWEKNSGYTVNWWIPGALQKEIIESTKINECKNGCIGILIWYFVHHTPINCWGQGPWFPST